MHFYVLAGITQINDASTRSFNGLLLYNTVTPHYRRSLHLLRGAVQTEYASVNEA